MSEPADLFEAIFNPPPAEIAVRKTIQIFGFFDAASANPKEDRWDGTCRELGKLLLEELSDGSWREASGKGYVSVDAEMLSPVTEASKIVTEDGLIFWPLVGELVRAGIQSEWISVAIQQGNLRRALATRS